LLWRIFKKNVQHYQYYITNYEYQNKKSCVFWAKFVLNEKQLVFRFSVKQTLPVLVFNVLNIIRPLLHVSVKLTEGYPSKNRSRKKSLGLLHVRVCYPLTDRCPFRLVGDFLRMTDR